MGSSRQNAGPRRSPSRGKALTELISNKERDEEFTTVARNIDAVHAMGKQAVVEGLTRKQEQEVRDQRVRRLAKSVEQLKLLLRNEVAQSMLEPHLRELGWVPENEAVVEDSAPDTTEAEAATAKNAELTDELGKEKERRMLMEIECGTLTRNLGAEKQRFERTQIILNRTRESLDAMTLADPDPTPPIAEDLRSQLYDLHEVLAAEQDQLQKIKREMYLSLDKQKRKVDASQAFAEAYAMEKGELEERVLELESQLQDCQQNHRQVEQALEVKLEDLDDAQCVSAMADLELNDAYDSNRHLMKTIAILEMADIDATARLHEAEELSEGLQRQLDVLRCSEKTALRSGCRQRMEHERAMSICLGQLRDRDQKVQALETELMSQRDTFAKWKLDRERLLKWLRSEVKFKDEKRRRAVREHEKSVQDLKSQLKDDREASAHKMSEKEQIITDLTLRLQDEREASVKTITERDEAFRDLESQLTSERMVSAAAKSNLEENKRNLQLQIQTEQASSKKVISGRDQTIAALQSQIQTNWNISMVTIDRYKQDLKKFEEQLQDQRASSSLVVTDKVQAIKDLEAQLKTEQASAANKIMDRERVIEDVRSQLRTEHETSLSKSSAQERTIKGLEGRLHEEGESSRKAISAHEQTIEGLEQQMQEQSNSARSVISEREENIKLLKIRLQKQDDSSRFAISECQRTIESLEIRLREQDDSSRIASLEWQRAIEDLEIRLRGQEDSLRQTISEREKAIHIIQLQLEAQQNQYEAVALQQKKDIEDLGQTLATERDQFRERAANLAKEVQTAEKAQKDTAMASEKAAGQFRVVKHHWKFWWEIEQGVTYKEIDRTNNKDLLEWLAEHNRICAASATAKQVLNGMTRT